jgi:hypothetical protein
MKMDFKYKSLSLDDELLYLIDLLQKFLPLKQGKVI